MWPGFQVHDPARRGRGYRSARCAECLQQPAHCLCALLSPRPTRTRVIVIMHAGEASRPTNTGRLAVRALAGARCAVRGHPEQPCELGDFDPRRSALLFPRTDARILGPEHVRDIDTLFVPDGTWAQTRRIVKRQPPLSQLPAFTLPVGAPTRYALRNAPDPGKLCTLEAIAEALAILGEPHLREALLAILQAAVDAGLYRRGLQARGRQP